MLHLTPNELSTIKISHLLVLVADVVPIVPSAMGHNVVEVGVGEDDPRVLPHCTAYVEWTGAGDPTIEKCESGLLVGQVSILGCYRSKSCCYRVKLTILLACTCEWLIKCRSFNINVWNTTRLQVYGNYFNCILKIHILPVLNNLGNHKTRLFVKCISTKRNLKKIEELSYRFTSRIYKCITV